MHRQDQANDRGVVGMSFPVYPEYRSAGLEWLNEVPAHWEQVPLWTLFNRLKRTGFADEQLLSVYRDFGVIPKASRDDNYNKSSDDLSAYQLVEPGDLAINKMKAWQGSVAISEYRGIVSPAYHIYKASHSESPRYLHHLFRCKEYISGYLSNSKGIRVNQWDLEPQQHSRMPVLLPPFKEQNQIARFLDHETAKIDALIREQERLIELLQEKRQAVISHAVTKGLDPDVPMKDSGVEWLGEIPAHWEAARVKHVATFITSGPRGWSDFITEVSGDVFLQSGDLDDNLGLKLATAKMVKPPAGAEGMRTKLKSGDVVVCITGANTGRVAVVEDLQRTTFINQHLSLIRTDVSQIDPRYLALSLSSLPGRSYFDVVQYGLKEGLSLSNVSEAPIALPSVEEQELIVKTLNKLISKFNALSKATSEEIALLQERRSALISAAVTGKIDVRNWQTPTEESAFGEKVRKAGVEATA
jgi:type I restriction enzyme S subunit